MKKLLSILLTLLLILSLAGCGATSSTEAMYDNAVAETYAAVSQESLTTSGTGSATALP